MNFQVISSDNAPGAIGPYSQAVKIGDMIYTSGQIPIDPSTGNIVTGGIEEQCHQVLKNIKAVLNSAGSDLSGIVKTTIFIKSMDDFQAVNKVYGEYIKAPYPARSCVEVSRLPKDVLVEIETIALL